MSVTHQQELGQLGEKAAVNYYVSRGCILMARNVRYSCGELDLIVQDGPTVVFVEVKTRSSDAFGGAESVSPRKFARIKRAAAMWLAGQSYRPVRFDVLVVMDRDGEFEFEHFEGIDGGAS